MPLAEALSAGSGIFGAAASVYNMEQQKKMNKQQLDFGREQSNLAWSRQQDMWSRTNEYNSPESQMMRFKAAGLNPHLIYGKGSSGLAAQTGTPQQAKWNPKAPELKDVGVTQSIGMYNDFRLKNAQIDNLKQIGLNLEQDNITKGLNNTIKGYKAQYAPYIESMSAQAKAQMIRNRSADLQKQMAGINRIVEQTRYEKWKHNFIESNKYSPEASPSMYKLLYDTYRTIEKPVKNWFNK